MSIFDFFRKKQKNEADQSAIKTLVRNIYGWFSHGDYTMENSEIIFSAVSRLSNALASMPVQLYKGFDAVNDELNDLIQNSPNPSMTSCNFFKTLEACRCTNGNGYALKVLNHDMSLERLDILDPTRVTPMITNDTKELWYRIDTGEGEIYVHNFYMIHVQFVSTSGYKGINPVNVLLDTLNYSSNVQKFNIDQLTAGINAPIALEAPSNLGEASRKKMVETFVNTYKETTGNILLLESGVTAKTLNLSPVDSKSFEVEKITRSKVAMVYNIPPHLLGDYSDTSFSSMEQQMLEFIQLTILPIITMYEQEFNRKLLTRKQRMEGYNFQFDMEALLRGDIATRAEANFKAIRSATKTPNEIRKKEGLPSDPDGNRLLISRDLVPLDIITNQIELLLGKETKKDEKSSE